MFCCFITYLLLAVLNMKVAYWGFHVLVHRNLGQLLRPHHILLQWLYRFFKGIIVSDMLYICIGVVIWRIFGQDIFHVPPVFDVVWWIQRTVPRILTQSRALSDKLKKFTPTKMWYLSYCPATIFWNLYQATYIAIH